jgi:DNA-directed RNA polymerase subunit RPC12/RpoP
MQVELSELQASLGRMSDEELLKMVSDDASQYRKEALDYARAEIARRGLESDRQDAGIECSKCAGRMEEGFIPDYGHFEIVRTARWVEGKPEKSFWTGTKIGGKREINISAYRCTSCGYMEFYAIEETSESQAQSAG